MRALTIVPLLLAGVLAVHYVGNRWKLPAEQAMMRTREPGEDLSGIWADAKGGTALLRLRHGPDDSLAGEYVPYGDRPVLCRFSGGRVFGQSARLDLKINGKLWRCQLMKCGKTLTLCGRKDTNALLEQYANDDRLPGGALIISPRNGQKRMEDALRLAQKREEIRRAGSEAVVFATFERIEGEGER